MTARPKFGAAIAVEGVRPAWLPDDVEFRVWNANRYTLGRGTAAEGYDWEDIQDIVLEVPRYDFVYLALERGMVPYFGQGAPRDWDGGPCLRRRGDAFTPITGKASPYWVSDSDPKDVIGYTSTDLPLAHPAAPQGEGVDENGSMTAPVERAKYEELKRDFAAIRKDYGAAAYLIVKMRERWTAVSDQLDHIEGGMFAGLEDAASAMASICDNPRAALGPAAIASGRRGRNDPVS